MATNEIIKSRRLELQLTLREVADAVGVSEGTVSRWESGDIANMRRDKISKLAEVLRIDPSVIMGWTPSNILKPAAHAVPILGTICAGNGIVAEESFSGKFFIDSSIEADYCLQVKGDSMIGAEIYDGDYAFLRKATEFRNGQIYAVLFGDTNEASLKVVHKQGEQTLILSPCNDDYSPIVTDTIDCYLIGELVGVYHSHEN